MSTPAPLDPAHFSLGKHGHPVQNGEIFFVSKSVGALVMPILELSVLLQLANIDRSIVHGMHRGII